MPTAFNVATNRISSPPEAFTQHSANTVGAPAAAVPGDLLLTGSVGGYFTGKSVINNVQTGHYAGLAYDF
jgi:hypothetical protein